MTRSTTELTAPLPEEGANSHVLRHHVVYTIKKWCVNKDVCFCNKFVLAIPLVLERELGCMREGVA